MKNENELNDMADILDYPGKYVPLMKKIEYDNEEVKSAPFSSHLSW